MLKTKVVQLDNCTVTLQELSARKSLSLGAPADDQYAEWLLNLVEMSIIDGMSPDDMSKSESLQLMKHALELNGFVDQEDSQASFEKK